MRRQWGKRPASMRMRVAFCAPPPPTIASSIGPRGAMNATLMAMLATRLPGHRLMSHEDLGIDSKAKEAIALAIIANDAVAGLNTNIPGATGGRPTVLGKISV